MPCLVAEEPATRCTSYSAQESTFALLRIVRIARVLGVAIWIRRIAAGGWLIVVMTALLAVLMLLLVLWVLLSTISRVSMSLRDYYCE